MGRSASRAVLASGPLPGGATPGWRCRARAMGAERTLSLWRECVDARFDRLELANLALERRGIRLCPPGAAAIVEADQGASDCCGAPRLDLAGRWQHPDPYRERPVACLARRHDARAIDSR